MNFYKIKRIGDCKRIIKGFLMKVWHKACRSG